jgi:hypothetical protein
MAITRRLDTLKINTLHHNTSLKQDKPINRSPQHIQTTLLQVLSSFWIVMKRKGDLRTDLHSRAVGVYNSQTDKQMKQGKCNIFIQTLQSAWTAEEARMERNCTREKKSTNNPAWGTTKYTVLHNQGTRDVGVWMGRWWKVVQTTQNTCIIQVCEPGCLSQYRD